jgi:hypothetical protein
MTTRCTACGKPTPHYGFYTTCTACDVKDQIEQSRIKVGAAGAVREYLDLIERRLLDAAMLPPMALDRPSSGAAAAAEERRQRRDDRVDALRYALTGRACGKYESAISGGCDKPAGHDGYCSGPTKGFAEIHGYDRGMPLYDFPCECGRTIRGTDRDRGKRCAHNGETVIWCAANGTWSCCRTDQHIRASCFDGHTQRIPTSVSAAHPSPFSPVQPAEPKPPTLREWLGDRVSELGRWAEVLREQPVPAGMIVAWHWDHSGPEWLLIASDRADKPGCGTAVMPDLSGVFDRCDDSTDITCWMESLQMALFHHHPDVKPEPALVRTWFGNEEDV